MVASEVGGVAIGNVQLSAAREAKPSSRRRGERKRTAFLGGPGVGSLDGEAWSLRGHESASDATDRVDRLRKLLRRAQSVRVTDLYTKGVPGDYYHVSDASPGERLGGAPGSRPWAVSIERDPDPFIVLEAEDHDVRHIGATADVTASPGGSDGKRVRYTPDTTERIVAKLGSSLVLYYRCETAAATETDLSGLGHVATKAGTVGSVAGKVGNGWDFDGTTGAYSVPDHSNHRSSAFTIEVWVKPDVVNVHQTVVSKIAVGGASVGYALQLRNNGTAWIALGTAAANVVATSSSVLVAGAWALLTATYDGANLRFYVNGALERTTAATGTVNTTEALLLGKHTSGEFFDGVLDEVRLGDRALTAEEVRWRYENTKDGTRPGNDHRAPLDQALDLDERSWRIRARVKNVTTNTGKYRCQAIDSAGADIGSAPAQVTPSAAGAWEVLELQAALAIPAAKAGANMLLLKAQDPTNTNGMDLDAVEAMPA